MSCDDALCLGVCGLPGGNSVREVQIMNIVVWCPHPWVIHTANTQATSLCDLTGDQSLSPMHGICQSYHDMIKESPRGISLSPAIWQNTRAAAHITALSESGPWNVAIVVPVAGV